MKFKNPFENIKKDKLILFFLIGILLVIIKIPTKSSNKTSSSEYNIQKSGNQVGSCNYEKEMEKELEEMLSTVTGVGNVRVAITYKDSGKTVSNTENNTSTSIRIEKEDVPEIQGVLIVAQGGDKLEIVSKITDAMSALLGISVNRIKVLKMEV